MTPSPSRILFKRSPRPSAVSATTIFVNFLVLAGSCNRHASRSRSFGLTTRHSSRAAALPVPVEHNVLSNREELSLVPVGVAEKQNLPENMHGELSKGLQAANLSTAIPTTNDSQAIGTEVRKPYLRHVPVHIFTRDLKALSRGKDIPMVKHKDLKNLFEFYIDSLGYEEAVKTLEAVLSNRERERGLGRSIYDDPYPNNHWSHPAVEPIAELLQDPNSSNQSIFRAYKDLPSPGVSYLSEWFRGRLLKRLADPPRPRRSHGLRYLLVLDDMCEAGLYISPAYWNKAIHLAGKCVSHISEANLTAALDVFNRMENEGKTPGDSVAFNTLFDIAVKAGQFKYADNIVNEMMRRGVEFSRFGRVAQIYYSGLRLDATAVREAYRDFVQSGEVVDTVVLNCVIVSLIRSGRFDLAEQMYDRMANAHNAISNKGDDEKRTMRFYPQPFDNYPAYRKASRRLGRVLGMAAYLHDKMPWHHRALQDALPLTPDAKTFHIFLSYHAFQSGDLEQFLMVLRAMEVHFSIPPQGMVYIFLFQGFSVNGSKPKSPWTLNRLRTAWKTFLQAVNDSSRLMRQKCIRVRTTDFIWRNPLTGEKRTVVKPFNQLDKDDGGREPASTPGFLQNSRPPPESNTSFPPGSTAYDDDEEDDSEEDNWRYENTTYLGRKVIVSSLYAFSACGGRDAVREVWAEIEPRWHPEHQKLADVVAVRKVLNRLLD